MPALLGQALPWTPLAVVGGWHSLVRAVLNGKRIDTGTAGMVPATVIAGDRLLWVWAVVPLAMLTLAPVKNAHYAISAQVPWSIWTALALARLGTWLRYRGFEQRVLFWGVRGGFGVLALGYGLGFWLLGPAFDRRGVEWAFYEEAGRQIPTNMPLTLLYDDWDRNPYKSPFGRIPHDLAVRLFYLRRSVCWHMSCDELLTDGRMRAKVSPNTSCCVAGEAKGDGPGRSIAVIARDRDILALKELGWVEVITRGPSLRRDRTYALFRVTQSLASLQDVDPNKRRRLY